MLSTTMAPNPSILSTPYRRSANLSVLVTPRDLEELRMVSEDWGVGVSTVVWAIIRDTLASARKMSHRDGGLGERVARKIWPGLPRE